MNSPFFSIIVVAYNAEETICETIQSILNQQFEDYEVIVKDGGSTDNTLSCIPNDLRIHTYSNPDKGIYDAMNEALNYSSGEYCCFLNCGDTFYSHDVLREIYDIIIEKTMDIYYGDFYYGTEYDKQKQISGFNIFKRCICHQTMFIRRELLLKYPYEIKYRIAADYDFVLHSYFNGNSFQHVDIPVCSYLKGGISETEEGVKNRRSEYSVIRNIYYKPFKMLIYNIIIKISFQKTRIWIKELIRKKNNEITN